MLKLEDQLNLAADTSIPSDKFSRMIGMLALNLLDRSLPPAKIEGECFHIIATVSEFDAIAVPIARRIKRHGGTVALTCAWTDPELVTSNPVKEIAPVRSTMQSGVSVGGSSKLILPFSVVGTTAVLKSLALYALFDQEGIEHDQITVLCPFCHRAAEAEFRASLPESYSALLTWECHRTEPSLAADGSLYPGIGAPVHQRLGFQNIDQTFEYIPNEFQKLFSPKLIDNPRLGSNPRP